MKFNWNPALFSEAVRQVVLALVLFGIINWTEAQIAGVLMALSAVLALFTITNTTPNGMLEAAGTSKTQVAEAARQNTAQGTPGGTGSPNTPGGAGGPTAPPGLGNFSSKDSRGGTGAGLLILALIPALFLAACGRPLTPADAAAGTKDVLVLTNDVHRAVFDGYVAGRIPGPQADPVMDGVEKTMLPAARKAVAAIRAWQAASTADLKKLKAGDVSLALDLLNDALGDLFGASVPPAIADATRETVASIRRSIDTIRAAIRTSMSSAAPPTLAPAN